MIIMSMVLTATAAAAAAAAPKQKPQQQKPHRDSRSSRKYSKHCESSVYEDDFCSSDVASFASSLIGCLWLLQSSRLFKRSRDCRPNNRISKSRNPARFSVWESLPRVGYGGRVRWVPLLALFRCVISIFFDPSRVESRIPHVSVGERGTGVHRAW